MDVIVVVVEDTVPASFDDSEASVWQTGHGVAEAATSGACTVQPLGGRCPLVSMLEMIQKRTWILTFTITF